MTQDDQKIDTRIIPRHIADLIQDKCPKPIIGKDDSPQRVGYLLGVQFVLDKVREMTIK